MTPDPLTDGFLMLAMLSAAFAAMGIAAWFIDRLLAIRDARRRHARQQQAESMQRRARLAVSQDRANDWIESRKRADAARRWC
jgi:hypothetical protein